MTGFCEHGNERSGSIKVGDLLAVGEATGFSGRTPWGWLFESVYGTHSSVR